MSAERARGTLREGRVAASIDHAPARTMLGPRIERRALKWGNPRVSTWARTHNKTSAAPHIAGAHTTRQAPPHTLRAHTQQDKRRPTHCGRTHNKTSAAPHIAGARGETHQSGQLSGDGDAEGEGEGWDVDGDGSGGVGNAEGGGVGEGGDGDGDAASGGLGGTCGQVRVES